MTERFSENRESSTAFAVSTGWPVRTTVWTIEDENAPDPQAALDTSEVKDRLSEAIQDLPERETLVAETKT